MLLFSYFSLQELNVFQDSLQTLKIAKSKFAGSKDALEQISEDWKEKEILVPLTGSMYVPGVINNIDKFVIDVGTGYYVEKVRSKNSRSRGCSHLHLIRIILILCLSFPNLRILPHPKIISNEKLITFKSKWIRLIYWAHKNRKY